MASRSPPSKSSSGPGSTISSDCPSVSLSDTSCGAYCLNDHGNGFRSNESVETITIVPMKLFPDHYTHLQQQQHRSHHANHRWNSGSGPSGRSSSRSTNNNRLGNGHNLSVSWGASNAALGYERSPVVASRSCSRLYASGIGAGGCLSTAKSRRTASSGYLSQSSPSTSQQQRSYDKRRELSRSYQDFDVLFQKLHHMKLELLLCAIAVSDEVSRLVILHEEAEDGNAMPDLTIPVQAVSRAVDNLVKVGYETIQSSDDQILRQDMPPALHRVDDSSKYLEDACSMLKVDPYSGPARKKLIEGARGILQGTSALLLCFDESEVRKIIRGCKKVLDYLAVAEVIESMDDLIQFVKDISPWLTRVSKDVDLREKELTHQVHREILVRCMDAIKTLAPILICSMKIFIQIHSQGGKGVEEAAENRNYLAQRMVDEINEIIRVLQLTTYDEDEWDADNLTVMKKAMGAIESLLQAALDWLADPRALRGGIGERSIRRILEYAERIASRALPDDALAIRRCCSDINSMTDSLAELRQNKMGDSPQAQGLARSIAAKLKELIGTKDQEGLLQRAIRNMEKSGIQQTAHTIWGRLEQALRWLDNPGVDDRGLGYNAIKLVTEEGRKLANLCKGPERQRLLQLCDDIDRLADQLADLQRRGLGDSPQAKAIAAQLKDKLNELRDLMQKYLTDRVIEDFADINTPLKQFTEAVLAPEGTPGRDQNFGDKARNLQDHSLRAAQTARLVATAGPCKNKRTIEALSSISNKVTNMTPQVINAGKIRFHYPSSQSADEHFENLRREFADALERMRNLVDEAIDTIDFVKASEDAIKKHTGECENAIRDNQPQKMVDNTSQTARLSNRVLMRAKNEADNSEDPHFVSKINNAADKLHGAIPPMVQDAKQVALNPRDMNAVGRWRGSNKDLIDAVGGIRRALAPDVPDMSSFHLNDYGAGPQFTPAPPRISPSSVPGHSYAAAYNQGSPSDYPSKSPVSFGGGYLGGAGGPGAGLGATFGGGGSRGGSASVSPRSPVQPFSSLSGSAHDVYPASRTVPSFDRVGPPPRPPPPPETDDEEETRAFWERVPLRADQPILSAAHSLHQEVRQWSSRENEIVAAAKRMAILMAKLSQLVRGEGGTKKDLIDCAKAIAEASEEVTRLAMQLARQCTDKRMRTALFQVCERIPTIGTQLKILSTVKATMLGSQGYDEDQEAMELLVLNAQNLMQSVKDTVRASEAASIKIRTDSGLRLRWIRKPVWSKQI